MKGRRAWTGIALLALAAAFSPIRPAWVERFYSNGLYAALQPVVTALSNRVPFALLDLLIALGLVAWFGLLLRDVARRPPDGWWLILLGAAARLAGLAAVAYLVFLLAWGLNYRRLPLTDKLQFEPDAVSAPAARRTLALSVDRLNDLYRTAHAEGIHAPGPQSPLAQSLARVQQELGARRLAVPGRPKATLLNAYFRRAGVEGMTDPYFLETLVASDLLDVEQPFVVAHEWSHLAGFADESEANFVGWLTCTRGTAFDQYSGWLFLYAELSRAVAERDRAAIQALLRDGPRADLRAIAQRVQRQVSPRLAEAGWRVYDKYLKANRVEEGAASYAAVVRLVLGVRFSPEGAPLLR